MALNFNGGGLRHGEVADELARAFPPKPFRDVSHHGDGRPANLVAHSEISLKRSRLRCCVYVGGQLSCKFPPVDVFEPSYHHTILWMTSPKSLTKSERRTTN